MKGYTSMIDGHIDEAVNGKKEYIDREALIAEYDRVHQGPAGGARKLMVDAPAADVVEVVRCKDCKRNVANMEKDPLNITDYSGDDIVCAYFLTDGMRPNDFCSYGQRKERK